MTNKIFSDDFVSEKELVISGRVQIEDYAAIIGDNVGETEKKKGERFADEVEKSFISDFEKSNELFERGLVDETDKMAHVSTFIKTQGYIFMTYYANTSEAAEDPNSQTARLVYCPADSISEKTYLDIQTVGDKCGGKTITKVYDTILMQRDKDTLYILWTAEADGNYYRLYRPFSISKKALGEVGVNRFTVGDITNDFSTSGIKNALAENGLPCKQMFSDIGIMQKLSSRIEDEEEWYYTGTYSGDFTCIIKSRDLVTWQYVSQPDFPNNSLWENATYVIGDKCFYFVRQHDDSPYGFLTVYDLVNKTWEKPVLIADCQSRGDFIMHKDNLYLFHAPIDREHIGIVKVDTDNIAHSKVLLQAHMHTSCFYPFVRKFDDKFAISYTVARKHIRLAGFDFENYL